MAEYLFADLMPEVAPHVANVTEQAVIRCARKATRHFCARTGFLKIETSPYIDIVSGTALYTITADDNGRPIVRADEVWVGSGSSPRKLAHRSADQLTREYGMPRDYLVAQVGTGVITTRLTSEPWDLETEYPPRYWFQPLPTQVRLVGIPNESESAALRIISCVKPALADVSVDDVIIENWYETIVKGTIAHLLLEPQKSYSNPQLGLKREQEFMQMTEDAVAEEVSGFADNDHVVGHVRAYP